MMKEKIAFIVLVCDIFPNYGTTGVYIIRLHCQGNYVHKIYELYQVKFVYHQTEMYWCINASFRVMDYSLEVEMITYYDG